MRGLRDLYATRPLADLMHKAIKLWRREGFLGLRRALLTIGRFQISFSRWASYYDHLTPSDLKLIQESLKTFKQHPVISFLLPVRGSEGEQLHRAIQSIRQQIYPHWELCVTLDTSIPTQTEAFIRELALTDDRIKVAYDLDAGSQIATALNTAFVMATGEFLALLGPGNELREHALYLVALEINRNFGLSLLYCDEDSIDLQGKRTAPYFKPDWNPDLFFAQNYMNNFAVYRSELVRSVGGFRIDAREAYDWDLTLRAIERLEPSCIHHIPHVLTHKRSTGQLMAHKSGQEVENEKVVTQVLHNFWLRQGIRVSVEALDGGTFRTSFPLPEVPPLVSIIIPTRNGLELLRRCLEGLFHLTDYPNKEVIVVDNNSDDPATIEFLSSLAKSGQIRLLKYDAPFNFSAINNMAVKEVHGEIICMLNNDVEPIGVGWLREMVSHCVRPAVGAVGAMLYYPDDTIQHAGVVLNGSAASHLYQGFPRGTSGDSNRARLVQNLSAVTAACLVVRKTIWDEVGGMDEKNLAVAFNDVDFCLKIHSRGYRNLWTPFAELYHHESVSRGRDDTHEKIARYQGELDFIRLHWHDLLDSDTAWNPNLALDGTWPRPAFPPRREKPWHIQRERH